MSSLGSLRRGEGGLDRLSLCLAELEVEDKVGSSSASFFMKKIWNT